jgi:predicted MPP superfamily phosphohydrolase
VISAETIKSYFERRLAALRNVKQYGPEMAVESLLREDLRFAERTLSRTLGSHHFELSLFSGGPEPNIMSYYDSAGHDYPRSREDRQRNPSYYRDKGYAVIELLDKQNNPMRILPETRNRDYNFTSEEQVSAIGSTVIYRFSNDPPAALVITCDKQDVFKAEDTEITTFVRAAGMAFEGEMVCSSLLRTDQRREKMLQASDLKCEVTWLHVSDMHFGAPPNAHRFDQKRVLDALLRDAGQFARVDYIFITGDIAYSGEPEQYQEAVGWITELANRAKVPIDRIRLLPGNHDVHRDTVRKQPMLRNAHESLRNEPAKLDEFLADKESREVLSRKLAAYKTELGQRFKDHPGILSGDFDWMEVLRTANGNIVNLVGLSTVWVSDEHDGGDSPDESLMPNMLLGGAQLASTLDKVGDPDFLIVLTHHPITWLVSSSRKLFISQLARHPHVRLCGHVHEAEGTLIRRLGDTTTNVTYVAGAAHGTPRDRHGYSWGALAKNGDEWKLGWAPRGYIKERNEFRPESTRFDLDEKNISWTSLKISK